MDSLLFMLILGVIIVVGIGLVGLILPRERRLTKEIEYDISLEKVWHKIVDFKGQADWRSDLESVEMLSEESWIETPKKGPDIQFQIIERVEYEYLKLEIFMNNRSIGFWTGEFIKLDDNKMKIVFNENVVADSPYFRIISRLFFSLEKGMNLYVRDLQNILESEKDMKG